ncbi:hypothetical protein ILUMI_09170 [Ignelater luminosus]|uniref:Apyrase n=1 Tax=Ignelater luminosus TaxID=2038154 RepID=A0A8K0D0B0_IGNLU|nr:hypothetical protein ILUMI_09170 [Ignelater luminosus]
MLISNIIVLISFIVYVNSTPVVNQSFQLSLIHLNDFHDRFEETSPTSGTCKDDNCIGGFSRVYAATKQLIKERPNPIVLNAGDNFQGTIWFSVYGWNVTQYFFNKLPTDAFTLGNHEFDRGVKEVSRYITAMKAPHVVANIDDSEEPDIQGLYNKSIVIEKYGKRIGIIGVISQRTNELSSTGKLRFLDESESVNMEAERLAVEECVDTIIVLSHCGYHADQVIAQNAAPKIGVIVGGHSHTFLYTEQPLPGPEKPRGPYPTVINHKDGRKILVVQASGNSKYLGNITVNYNKNGDVISWSGAPIYLNRSIPQDHHINHKIELWKHGLDDKVKKVLGYTNVVLQRFNCYYEECNLGNLLADAMVYSYLHTDEEDAWSYAAIAITNSGGIRVSIPKGKITYNDIALAVPFLNTFDVMEIQGKYLRQLLEYAAGHHNNTSSFKINLMQVSGLRIVYNTTKPIGSRIISLKARCRVCPVPLYQNVEMKDYYRIVVNSFIAGGGDGHTVLVNNARKIKVGEVDIDALVKYIEKHSPIIQELQNRITVLK